MNTAKNYFFVLKFCLQGSKIMWSNFLIVMSKMKMLIEINITLFQSKKMAVTSQNLKYSSSPLIRA